MKLEGSLSRLLTNGSEREDIVVKALQECQEAIDTGKPIDRSAILAKYPAIRDELSACLDGLALMQLSKVDCDQGRSNTETALPITPSGTLGDFRIQNELGRGGMGVVYEAEQLSVGRKVALKVLPYAAMLDKRQIARFQNEARAAATLEHPHIVPVYFVGNERGVYYYAMRLIDGRNLAEVMGELRGTQDEGAPLSQLASQLVSNSASMGARPVGKEAKTETGREQVLGTSDFTSDQGNRSRIYFESIARVGVQVAEALEYAHSHGIIHRDVKPANIILDVLGDAWITDFGLARIEADAGLTMTGDLIGTLRYMSPEQTTSNRMTIDHRSDIYSLGATLFELLTLRPLFVGDDRATVLRQIAEDEPVLPSKIDAKIPRDLETIVLKAIRKSKDDRYETAQELADDLNRFLSHQPVLARRTPMLRRIRMWTRRHPTLFGAATLLCAISLFSAAVIGFLVAQYEHDGRVMQEEATAEIASALRERGEALERVITQRKRADAAAIEANELRIIAESRAGRLRQQLYVREMRQAFDAWESGWTDQVLDLLARQVPAESEPDLRGFEWQVLSSLTYRRPSVELVGHDGAVHDLALLPNGRRIASVGEDGTMRIWNLESNREEFMLRDTRNAGKLIGSLGGVLDGVLNRNRVLASTSRTALRALAVSPDGTKLATGNMVLSLWDLEHKKFIRDLAVFPTRIFGVAFSPDGKLVAAQSSDEGVKVANVDGGLVKSAYTGSGSYRLSFSPDGDHLAAPFLERSPTKSRGIRCWNTQDWHDAVDYPTRHSVRGCTFSRDGEFLFCGGYEGDAFILNLDSGSIQVRIPQQRSSPNDIAVSEHERSFAVAYEDGTVAYTQLPDDWKQLKREENLTPRLMAIHDGAVNAVQFVGNDRIATCGSDGLIRISTVNETDVKDSFRSETMDNRCKFRPNADELIVASTHGIDRYDSHSWELVDAVDFGATRDYESETARVMSLGIEARGDIIAIGNIAGEIVVYDLEKNCVVHRILQTDVRPSAIGDIAFSPDGKWMANGSRDHTIRVRSTADWREVYRVSTQGWGSNVEFSPDGMLLAYTDSDGNIALVESSNWQEVARRKTRSGLHRDTLRFTQDGEKLISGHKDSVIRVWHTDKLAAIGELKGHMKSVLGLNLHKDGETLASAGEDNTVRLWKLPTLAQLGTLDRLDAPAWNCEFSPDGLQLAVIESKQRVTQFHVWDISDGENVMR